MAKPEGETRAHIRSLSLWSLALKGFKTNKKIDEKLNISTHCCNDHNNLIFV